MKNQTFVRRERKRWGLSQEELSTMLALNRSTLSRIEAGAQTPPLHAALGLQVVFGLTPHLLFSGLYKSIEDRIMRHASKLDQAWGRQRDEATALKRKLLSQMVGRVRNGYNCA